MCVQESRHTDSFGEQKAQDLNGSRPELIAHCKTATSSGQHRSPPLRPRSACLLADRTGRHLGPTLQCIPPKVAEVIRYLPRMLVPHHYVGNSVAIPRVAVNVTGKQL